MKLIVLTGFLLELIFYTLQEAPKRWRTIKRRCVVAACTRAVRNREDVKALRDFLRIQLFVSKLSFTDSHLQQQSSDNSDAEHEIIMRALEEHSSDDGDQSFVSVPHAVSA